MQVAGLLYIDTCLEPMGAPWGEGATPLDQRTNYAMRETLLAMRRKQQLRHAAAFGQAVKPQAGSVAAGGAQGDTSLVSDQAGMLGFARCDSLSASGSPLASVGRAISTSSSMSSMDLAWDTSNAATRSSSPCISRVSSTSSMATGSSSAVAAQTAASNAGSIAIIPRSLSLGAGRGLPTALLVSGANPGMVEHFVKAGLWHLAQEAGSVAPGQGLGRVVLDATHIQ
jgi:hypothetical protein